ncbi:NADP-dependent oxidoreductase domain-containing protein [Dactylonectria estremocensis]|uniref:NADP-dependent oxidoreductase domain-containing protein n=1 Tax=Dactylonectria estremocensis TaxID=1079267 RepID=A0A9P9FK46_9HYPO|nr:NADP-dependent oxidoreductase domain-containing protein [Dactylonectria estremocensis]
MAQILGKQVGTLGFGLMGFTWRPVPPPLDQALEAMRTAVEKGVTVWNGGEFYGTPEYNSMTLLKHYFTKYPEDADKVTVFMKGGLNFETHALDGSPEGVRRTLDNIIAQMEGTKKIDGFAYARRDTSVPLEVTLGVIQKEYIDTGKIGGVYVSECSAETIHEASKHAKIIAAEVELSMFSPDILKNGVAAACAQYNIPVLAYSPIGRGMLTGRFTNVSDVKDLGLVAALPRFQEKALEHNLKLVSQVQAQAGKKGCTPAQLAIGWVRGLSNRPGLPTIIPIPGATTKARVEENATLIDLSEEEMKVIGGIVDSFTTSGGRYPDGAPIET